MSDENKKSSGYIDTAGRYQVTIQNPHWEALPEKLGDANRMAAVLPGVTNDGKVIDARLLFVNTIIGSGKNSGVQVWRVSQQKLIELGMQTPFDPSRLIELDGVTAEYVVEMREYDGRELAVVKFINVPRREIIDDDRAKSIWAALSGGDGGTAAKAKAKPKPAPAPEPDEGDDDLPF